MKSILLTGAYGQLGLSFGKLFHSKYEIHFSGRNYNPKSGIYLDITNPILYDEVLNLIKPDLVINFAALTNVDLCEKNPELGYITERGTKFVAKRFSEILKKKNIDKALAIEEAAKLGWVIPEHEFEIIKRVAGRPKKNKVVEVKEKKKRGRPLKNKNVEIVKGDADLKQIIDNIKSGDIIDQEYVELEEEIEVSVEEEIEVINFMFNDIEYLKDTENIIYDINTQAEIGVYKKDLKHIEFY